LYRVPSFVPILLDLFQPVAPLVKPSAFAAIILVVFQALLFCAVLLLVDVAVLPDANNTLRNPFLQL